jgi:hypothetical protein
MGYGYDMESMMEGGYEGSMYGGATQQKKGAELISRRQLMTDLFAVSIGLQGPDRKSGVGGVQSAEAFVDEVAGTIRKLAYELNDDEADDESLVAKITEAKSALDQLIQNPQAAATATGVASGR